MYNINELLEYRKEIEKQIRERMGFSVNELIYTEKNIIDFTNEKNNRTMTDRARVTSEQFCQEIFGLIDQLAKVKTSIQKYNAEQVAELLNTRDAIRSKIKFLEIVKKTLPKEKKQGRQVTRQNDKNETLEVTEIVVEPMFELKPIEKQFNEFAAQERKLNTEIQKTNLNVRFVLIV